MLVKPLKLFSYSALTVALYMGNITKPISYFDDDENFTAVASHLLTGWEFSFNKAFATCGSGSDPGVCPNEPDGYPEVIPDPIEVIEVGNNNPPAPDPEPWTGTPDPQPTDPDGSDQGGGGGGGTNPTEEAAKNKERCLIQATASYDQCLNDVQYQSNNAYSECLETGGLGDLAEVVGMPNLARAIKRCERRRDYIQHSGNNYCISEREKAQLQCI